MASIKVKFRPALSDNTPGTIFYQIFHAGSARRIVSDFSVFPSEWDARRERISSAPPEGREKVLLEVAAGISRDVERISGIVKRLEGSRLSFSADDIVEQFNFFMSHFSLFTFMSELSLRMSKAGKHRTSETYLAALKSFRNFRKGKDIMLDAISADVMEDYEAWLRGRGLTLNSISFYTRILRAVYNRAVENDIIRDRHPFRHVYTGVDKTRKRALPLATLHYIKDLNLKDFPDLDLARDLFILSFYLRGMSFVDMAFLKKENLHNGYITYRRRKTGQQLMVKWTLQMQAILNKYPPNPTPYLLPILRTPGEDVRTLYRNMAYATNYSLKKLSYVAGLDCRLTMYVARHSWATAAKAEGIPLSVISKGMGHDSESTTLIYLASLDYAAVDHANSMLINALG